VIKLILLVMFMFMCIIDRLRFSIMNPRVGGESGQEDNGFGSSCLLTSVLSFFHDQRFRQSALICKGNSRQGENKGAKEEEILEILEVCCGILYLHAFGSLFGSPIMSPSVFIKR
jgi:hypothetical protein